MIRLFGALMIFLSCSAVGLLSAEMHSRRVSELEAFAALIAYIGAQIEFFLTPLEKIYVTVKDDTLERTSFLKVLREVGGVRALAICRHSLHISQNEYAELERFFEGLGHHSAGEEAKHCTYYEKNIRALATAAREQLPSKKRVCRSVGMLFGVILALVLL